MQPGRELDALIAEKVFGCKVLRPFDGHGEPADKEREMTFAEYEQFRGRKGYHCDCPGRPHIIEDGDYYGTDIKEYSTRIQDAWAVVEKLAADGYGYTIHREFSLMHDKWIEVVRISKAFGKDVQCAGNTIPHSICLCALKALSIS